MTNDQLGEAAECLKAMAHPQRLRILQMLLHRRFTVGEIAEACAVPSPVAVTLPFVSIESTEASEVAQLNLSTGIFSPAGERAMAVACASCPAMR